MKKRAFLILLLGAASGLAFTRALAGLPLWLDSPSRGNHFDPKSDGYIAPTPTPSGPVFSPTPPFSATVSPTWTPTVTPTFTVTFSDSPTALGTFTDSPTYTFSPTQSETFTHTPTFSNSPTNSHTPTATATASSTPAPGPVACPWNSVEVGTVAGLGSALFNPDGSYTVRGLGFNVGSISVAPVPPSTARSEPASYQFACMQITGDVTIIARLVGPAPSPVPTPKQDARAGLVITETLDGYSKLASIMTRHNDQSGPASILYTGAGAYVSNYGDSGAVGPVDDTNVWLKIVRAGNTFTTFSSGDGATWSLLSTAIISMANPVYAGLAVAGDGADTGYVFDNVSVTGTQTGFCATPTSTPTAIAMPSPVDCPNVPGVNSEDIGTGFFTGSAWSNSAAGLYWIQAGGESWGVGQSLPNGDAAHPDKFRFVYQEATGDNFTVIARVLVVRGQKISEAGIMMRDSRNPAVTTNMFGALLSNHFASDHFARSGGVVTQAWGQVSPAGWVKVVETTGGNFTSFESHDGISWTGPVLSATIPAMVGATKYIGIAVDYGCCGWREDNFVDSFSITPGGGSALTGACLVTPTVTPTP